MRRVVAGIVLGCFLVFPQICNAKQIDLASLLEEMLDRRKIAEFPQPEFVCKQASSYNRRSKSPGNPDWFASGDFCQFYGSNEIEGCTEWIMLDVEGPGAVARWWQTQFRGIGTIRIYLDGASEPIFASTTAAILRYVLSVILRAICVIVGSIWKIVSTSCW